MGVSVEHFVSLTPIETQVFTSLSYKVPVFVGTLDGKTWKVDQSNITTIEDNAPGVDGVAARALAGEEEGCKEILSKLVDGTAKYFIGSDVKVISVTERSDKFAVTAPDGATVASVMRARQTIVPSPNDFKVLQAGIGLYILDRGAGHSKREGILESSAGQLQFRIVSGDPLSLDLQSKINARLNEMQTAEQTSH